MTKTDPTAERDLRKPTIYSDAILAMLRAPAKTVNGLLELDEDFLRDYAGVKDFSKYSVVEGSVPRRIMPAKFPDLVSLLGMWFCGLADADFRTLDCCGTG